MGQDSGNYVVTSVPQVDYNIVVVLDHVGTIWKRPTLT